MREIGTFETKNKLSALLARVEQGEEFLITRRGKVVAKLSPAQPGHNQKAALAAAARIRANAKKLGMKFDWAEWKTYRDEGRR